MDLLNKNIFSSGKGLFVYSDPGGAKGILSLIYLLKGKKSFHYDLVSDRDYSFTKDYDLKVDIVENINNFSKKLNEYSYIVTGTSYTSNIENDTLRIAKTKRIPTFSFVDHWVNIKNRFLTEEGLHYPNKIWLIDEKAKKIGIEEGVPKELIEVVGNPSHNYLSNWSPKSNKLDFCLKHKLSPHKSIIVFAPDSVSNLDWKDKYGFDEGTLTLWVISSMEKIGLFEDFQLVVKLHPNQNSAIIENSITDFISSQVDVPIHLRNQIHTNTLLHFSEIIIGQFSNILVEAQILGNNNIIRIIPNGSEDYLLSIIIGEICTDETTLTKELQKKVNEFRRNCIS